LVVTAPRWLPKREEGKCGRPRGAAGKTHNVAGVAC